MMNENSDGIFSDGSFIFVFIAGGLLLIPLLLSGMISDLGGFMGSLFRKNLTKEVNIKLLMGIIILHIPLILSFIYHKKKKVNQLILNNYFEKE